jgi:predicted dehydrogenase
VPAQKKIKLGVVGCGYVARLDYFPILARPEVRERLDLVAVCDVVEAAAKSAAEEFGAQRYYTDFQKIVDDKELDALALITPIPLHYEQAKASIEAGKHTYVQKTMTMTVEEATDLIQRARRRGVLLTAAPGMMISPYMQMAKRLIESGHIGKVCYARGRGAHAGYERNTDPSWRYKEGGGPVRNTGVYPLHCLTGLLGAVKRVSAFSGIAVPVRYYQGQPIQVETDDNTVFNLDFGDASFGQVDSSYQVVRSETPQIEVYGTKGTISVQGWSWARHPRPIAVWSNDPVDGLVKDEATGWWVPPPGRDRPDPKINHTMADLLHFADVLIDGKPLLNGPEHARHVIEVINKGYESAKTGQVQSVETVPFPEPVGAAR